MRSTEVDVPRSAVVESAPPRVYQTEVFRLINTSKLLTSLIVCMSLTAAAREMIPNLLKAYGVRYMGLLLYPRFLEPVCG